MTINLKLNLVKILNACDNSLGTSINAYMFGL